MSTDNVIPFVSRAEENHMVLAAVVLPLAAMIHAGSVDPESITRDAFFDALRQIAKAGEPVEIYVTRVEEEMRLVQHCIAEGEAKSGIVLLFTLLEGEANTLLRMHLRIRGFSANDITVALRGTDFDTKLHILLPLVGVSVPERIRNTALQCKVIRNMVVHNKATPGSLGGKQSDAEIAVARSEKFFAENPVARLRSDIKNFVEIGLSQSDDVQWAHHLFEKYYERSEV